MNIYPKLLRPILLPGGTFKGQLSAGNVFQEMIFLIFLMFSTKNISHIFNVFHKIIFLSFSIFCSPNLSYANQISNLLE